MGPRTQKDARLVPVNMADHLALICEMWMFFQPGNSQEPILPAWISNHTTQKVWDEITNPFPNSNGSTIEV